MNLVIHLLDLSVIGKYLSAKYFIHFGTNHPLCEMKQEPHIRHEILVIMSLSYHSRKCFMNVCIDLMGTIYLMYNHGIDWKKSIKSYVRRNQYLVLLTIRLLLCGVVDLSVL